jgi:Eukaryotic protein of unknown function (DUF829)
MAETTPLLVTSTSLNSNGLTTATTTQNGSTGLSKLSPTVYFLQPTGKPSIDSPSAILIFSWMGAPLRHMTKFIDYYSQTMFPNSPIILILSPKNQFMANEIERKKALGPAYTAYQSLNIQPDNVLVHIFSNGGVNGFRTFVSLTPTKSFSPKELVLDSAPGVATLKIYIVAFTVDIKNAIARFFLSIFRAMVYFWIVIRDWVLRREPILEALGRWLLEGSAIGKKTKRLFLYSDKDELIQKENVEEHIRQLKERGYPIRSRNFGKTRHVGHMRADPENYWSEILKVWKE